MKPIPVAGSGRGTTPPGTGGAANGAIIVLAGDSPSGRERGRVTGGPAGPPVPLGEDPCTWISGGPPGSTPRSTESTGVPPEAPERSRAGSPCGRTESSCSGMPWPGDESPPPPLAEVFFVGMEIKILNSIRLGFARLVTHSLVHSSI